MHSAQAALLLIEPTKAGVPADIDVYTKGGHGYGIQSSKNIADYGIIIEQASFLRTFE